MSKLTVEQYEAKRQARYESLLAAAAKVQKESDGLVDAAHSMASIIPLGQPILVGHYSEGRDRRYRNRIENKFRKGYELASKAKDLQERAAAMKKNAAIFSEDPAAEEKLEEKIKRLEDQQELMKAANKLVRKGDREGLADLGFSPTLIEKLFTPDFADRTGFPSYRITNNGAEIRRLKQRLESIQAHADDETNEITINGIQVIDNVEENRLQIFFTSRVPRDVFMELKRSGFRHAPSVGEFVFQAYRTNGHSLYAARRIIEKYFPQE